MYADIILPLHLPKALTYGIPLEWQGEIAVGKRVEVNMGRQKLYAGIVAKIHHEKPELYAVKPIRSVIDSAPIVRIEQLQLWQWIAEYYICTIGEVMQAALPAHLKLMSESLLIWSGMYEDVPLELSDDAFVIAEALLVRKQITIAEAQQIVSGKSLSKAINEVLESGAALVSEQLEERYKPKTETHVRLASKYDSETETMALFQALEKKPKQLSILMSFLHQKRSAHTLSLKILTEKSNATGTQVRQMAANGIFTLEDIEVDRVNDGSNQAIGISELSEVQSTAKELIEKSWAKKNVCLLQGVTGSGKTHVYITLIKEMIEKGEQALFLLPEIALTTHILSRLRAYFGEELGVYHSKYSNNERAEIWKKVANRQYKVVIGPRSAMWLPFVKLGLIIVDEEHDSSYKQQEPAPRFHARDAAIYLSNLHRAKVLLGSATPSIESLYNVQKEKYGYVLISQRHLGVDLPEIIPVNAHNTQVGFSPVLTLDLLSGIQDAIKLGKQVILFQNKRGYAPFLVCGSCGFVPQCKYCDVSLTYHKSTDKLHCHYCGTKSATFKHCPSCGNVHISARTFGTEKIEEDLHKIFPHLSIARMDWDSMRTKGKQNQLLSDFSAGKINVLVGTQMVVKGLDFEHVALVGVLSADSLLGYPDFRVHERAYQLMEQVSGRAGRTDGKGKVMIQTLKPQHPIIQFVIQHDYKAYYEFEINYRQQFIYPPFARLIKIIFKHKDQGRVAEGAQIFTQNILQKFEGISVLGPAEALVPRVRNYYVQELLIKLPLNNGFITEVKQHLAQWVLAINKEKGMSQLICLADVDPY